MSNISRERIIETAANLSNKAGLENLSLKMIAEELKIKSPSLYNTCFLMPRILSLQQLLLSLIFQFVSSHRALIVFLYHQG